MFSPAPYLVAAWALVYAPTLASAAARASMQGGYDNRTPRKQQSELTGLAARAVGAHNNGFETFAPFAAALILCAIAGVDPSTAQALACAFLTLRVLYIGFYLGDLHVLRSTTWIAGAGCTLALFVLAMRR